MRSVLVISGIIILIVGIGLIGYGFHLEAQMSLEEEVESYLTSEGRAEQAKIAMLEISGVLAIIIGIIVLIVGLIKSSDEETEVQVQYASTTPQMTGAYHQHAYNCYACKNQMEYVFQYQKWYCRSCNRYP